jgi:hypothetical protein
VTALLPSLHVAPDPCSAAPPCLFWFRRIHLSSEWEIKHPKNRSHQAPLPKQHPSPNPTTRTISRAGAIFGRDALMGGF